MHKSSTVARRFFLLALLALAFALPAAAQSSTALMQRMVGAWVDGENFYELGAEGQIVVHLKKGQVADERALHGEWWVEESGVLMVALIALDRVPSPLGQVSFDGDTMVFTTAEGYVIRNRRHAGAPPPEFVW